MLHHKQTGTRVMLSEINEIPSRVEKQLAAYGDLYRETGTMLRQFGPRFVTTSARGSSDCAAMYLKYLVETRIGIPVASIGPSVASLYQANLQADGGVSFAISQSGGSEDIIALHRSLQLSGAKGFALINANESLLGEVSQHNLPLGAGDELAVPATKSFVCSLVAIASLVAQWSNDSGLIAALEQLPDALAKTLSVTPDNGFEALQTSNSAFVLGRGPSLAVVREAALKLKETAYIHAEAFSAAEILHGPAALVVDGFPCVIFPAHDQSRNETGDTADRLANMGAKIISIEVEDAEKIHPLLLPLIQITRFYVLAERLAQSRGINPDESRNLRKVTNTL